MEPVESSLGPRVIGEEAYLLQQARQAKTADVLGPRVTGVIEPQQPATNPFILDPDVDGDGYVNLTELRAKLEAEPHLLPLAIEAEYRDGKPRKGALAIFARIQGKLAQPAAESPPTAAGLSIAEVTAALEQNPAAVGELLTAELVRVDGPRQPVLVQLREVESQRPADLGGPRGDLLALIDEALAG